MSLVRPRRRPYSRRSRLQADGRVRVVAVETLVGEYRRGGADEQARREADDHREPDERLEGDRDPHRDDDEQEQTNGESGEDVSDCE